MAETAAPMTPSRGDSAAAVAIIGRGAIGRWIAARLEGAVTPVGRDDPLPQAAPVVEAAGHEALAAHGPQALAHGADPPIASVGALADPALEEELSVAATVALSGPGLERTRVQVVADPGITTNRHVVAARGAFGSFEAMADGVPMPDNPCSSSLTAMRLLRATRNRTAAVVL